MIAQALGRLLGEAYIFYAVVLFLGCLGGHILGLVTYLRLRGSTDLLTFELLYGLVNPIVYLAVLRPGLLHGDRALVPLLFALLAAYWALRFGHAYTGLTEARLQKVAVHLLELCAGVIAVMAFVDLGAYFRVGDAGALFAGALYAFPIGIALKQRALLERGSVHAHFFRRSGGERSQTSRWALAGAALIGGVTFMSLHQPPRDVGEAFVREHRSEIVSSAVAYGIDPRLVAAIVFVNQTQGTNAFRSTLEESAAIAWLADEKSHMGLAEAVDPSLGLAQIKPVTALSALAIGALQRGETLGGSKQYREVPYGVVDRVAAGTPVVPTPMAGVPTKAEVVAALVTPESNIRFCAYLLGLYAAQWETAGHSIRQRPAILATLYSLGFAKSFPKPNPLTNDFGLRVERSMNEPWMLAEF